MEICSSYRCAVRQQKCSAAQVKMHSPLFSSALQNRLTAGLCHCNGTYGYLLFTQVCSEATEMQCCTGQNAFPTVQQCSAKQAHSRLVSLQWHLWRSASYRCAVRQQKCSAAQVWAESIPHCSVVLCKTGSQQACVTAMAPMEICSSYRCAVRQQKCSAAQVEMHSPLFSSALQNRLTAGLCHCNGTYRYLLFLQMCSEAIEMQCGTGQNAFPTVQQCSVKQAHSRLVSLQ